jgi:hypothetical protein
LNNVFGFTIAVLLFAMIFKVLPAVDPRWTDVWIGALGTAFLFTLGKLLIGFYLGQSALVSSYGAAGSLMTVLLWICYSSLLLLLARNSQRLLQKRTAAAQDGARPMALGDVPESRMLPQDRNGAIIHIHAVLPCRATTRHLRCRSVPRGMWHWLPVKSVCRAL